MNLIASFISTVVIIDSAFIAGTAVHPVAGGVVAGLGVGAGVMASKNQNAKSKPKKLKGWELCEGVELTNPDLPIPVQNVVLQDKALQLGVLAIGSPGGGKSESYSLGILDYYTKKGSGWSYFEGKGQVDILQKGEAAGVKPDYLFSSVLEHSHTINLMDSIDVGSITERLVKTLIDHDTTSTNFYADEQTQVLNRVIPVICGLGYQVTLRDLFAFLTVQEAAVEVIHLAKEKDLPVDMIKLAESWVYDEQTTGRSNIKGMVNKLFQFVTGPASARINAYNPNIRLHEIVNSGKRIYFHLPLSDMSRRIAIMVTEELAIIASKRQSDGPDKYEEFPQVFDDWGGMVHSGFTTYTARCRSAKMPPSFTFQSPAQLEELGPEFRNQMEDNIAVKLFFRVTSERTARLCSDLIGNYETFELGRNYTEVRGTGVNVQALERPRVNKDVLYELAAGEAIIATLEIEGRNAARRIYRGRFPLLDSTGWESISPKPKAQSPARDHRPPLYLYDRYIKDEAIACEIQQEVNAESQEQRPQEQRPQEQR
ncbi:type IV secretory system conjugative DNA transfer family protein, partial [Ferrimonas kyonanensis]|uniref:type IV secretory system conjugative DNA transfer family protein n=1 Tax=Ferrimonas kyonanensis TaxID=364763 RepID=UPI00054F14D6